MESYKRKSGLGIIEMGDTSDIWKLKHVQQARISYRAEVTLCSMEYVTIREYRFLPAQNQTRGDD